MRIYRRSDEFGEVRKIAKVVSLVLGEAFYCMPEVELLKRPSREDGKLRILTQSDPYVSRFIWRSEHT